MPLEMFSSLVPGKFSWARFYLPSLQIANNTLSLLISIILIYSITNVLRTGVKLVGKLIKIQETSLVNIDKTFLFHTPTISFFTIMNYFKKNLKGIGNFIKAKNIFV